MNPCRVELAEANAFVAQHHRHHKPVTGHRFSVGVEHGGKLVGVAIVGRPVARQTDQRNVAEVLRLCTDGTRNACTWLYGAAARIAAELGFERIQTFILETESGTSLIASGWTMDGKRKDPGKGWQSRAGRDTEQPTETKTRWSKALRKRCGKPSAPAGKKGEGK